MPRNKPHDQPVDLSAIDYSALTMKQRHAFTRAVIRRAHDERDRALQAIFIGLARGARNTFAWLIGRKRNRRVAIPGRTIARI